MIVTVFCFNFYYNLFSMIHLTLNQSWIRFQAINWTTVAQISDTYMCNHDYMLTNVYFIFLPEVSLKWPFVMISCSFFDMKWKNNILTACLSLETMYPLLLLNLLFSWLFYAYIFGPWSCPPKMLFCVDWLYVITLQSTLCLQMPLPHWPYY